MLRSNTVLSFCFFLVCMVSGCGGGTAPPRGAPTLLARAEGEAAHKQLATLRSVRFRPQGRRRQRISVAVNGSHLDLVHSGSHQTHTFAV